MGKQTELLSGFGSRIRALRSEQGLSQEDLADKCGLDRTYIGGIERGERNPALRNISKIARSLNISLSKLFEGIDERPA
jgi:transcriptional regulator with XRE-family HTH domain